MKRIKLSEAEVLAVIINLFSELNSAFDLLPDKGKETGRLKKQILTDLHQLLYNEYRINLAENNLYDALFKNEKVVQAT